MALCSQWHEYDSMSEYRPKSLFYNPCDFLASFSFVQRIRNFVHYSLPEKAIFQNLCRTPLITYFVIISLSAAYFGSFSLVRRIKNVVHYKKQKNLSFQNIPETAQTCFIIDAMSVAHSASSKPV